MKKAIAIIIALMMLVAFATACGDKDTGSDTPPAGGGGEAPASSQAPPPESQAPASAAPTGDSSGIIADTASGTGASGEATEIHAYPNCNPDGSINLDTIAHYDINYDYFANDRIKCTYIAQAGGPLYQMSADAYEHWAPLYNMEWMGFQSSNGDPVLFMDMLQQSLDQGVRCFILDPDNTIFPTVMELMDRYPDAAWLSQMAGPRDGTSGPGIPPGGHLINNYVGFDNYDAGIQVTKRVLQWKEENIPDVPWEDIGMICMAFTPSPPLNERVNATRDLWIETTGSDRNFFAPDAAPDITFQGGLDAVGPVITTNTDIQYWLVNGLIDDFAQAAATIIDQQGLTDNSCVACFGGSGWVIQTDAGTHDSFRFALFTAQNLYAEPIIGGVYAFLQGWATPESIWPTWLKWDDHGADGHTFSQLRLPTVWLTPETYKHYLAWTDMYANANAFPDYPRDGIPMDAYTPFVADVPADFFAP